MTLFKDIMYKITVPVRTTPGAGTASDLKLGANGIPDKSVRRLG